MTLLKIIIFLTFVFTIYNTYLLSKKKEDPQLNEKQMKMLKERLPDLKNTSVEITFKEPMPMLDLTFQSKGTILDFDDQWLLLSVIIDHHQVQRIVRISMIEDIKEIG